MADLGAYNHTQSSASATWTIVHSLGTRDVVVDAFVNVGSPELLTKAIPVSQEADSTSQVIITWSAAQSGVARVVGGGT